MKFEGKVTERIDAQHNQVRVSGAIDLGNGQKPQPVELILSTASDEVMQAFQKGQSVSFVL